MLRSDPGTVFLCLRFGDATPSNVGASLLAKALCQSIFKLTDTPPSRAGSLPQLTCVGLCDV
ncbi:hypothetical protein C0J26_05915 [Pseudomonas baetica]|nr:hypothetical protein C0J26_05915 [Pseudomonas baetica]